MLMVYQLTISFPLKLPPRGAYTMSPHNTILFDTMAVSHDTSIVGSITGRDHHSKFGGTDQFPHEKKTSIVSILLFPVIYNPL